MVNGPSDLSPEDRLHLQAAEGWAALGNLAEARAELERIGRPGQSHVDAQSSLEFGSRENSWADCLHIAHEIVRLFPEWRLGSLQLGLNLYKLGRVGEAIQVLEKAIERFGEGPLFVLGLACCYGKAGSPDHARRIVEQAIERQGDPGWDAFLSPALFDYELGALWKDDDCGDAVI